MKPLNSGISSVVNRNGSVSINYVGAKSISYTAEVKKPDWTQPVNVRGKITYVNHQKICPCLLAANS